MVKIYITDTEQYYIDEINNFSLIKKYDGMVNLIFDISPNHSLYKYLIEERKIEFNNIFYIIKSINQRAKLSTISAELDLDSLKDTIMNYTEESETFANMIEDALEGSGWAVMGADLIPNIRSFNLTDVNRLDILKALMNEYQVVYKYDTKNKIIYVENPSIKQYTGKYLTEELNLISKEYKGESTNFATRIYPYGKTTEIENEDGTKITYTVDITSVNDGIEYIDNNTYSNKVIPIVWRDDRYTEPQSLKDAAIEMLKKIAVPTTTYTLRVVDLSKKDDYGFLVFNLYDKVLLIDSSRKTTLTHQVVEIKEYPLEPIRNEITLSAVAQTVKATINSVVTNQVKTEADLKKLGLTVNANSEAVNLELNQRYTKGETDAQIDNQINISAEELTINLEENYSTKEEVNQKESQLLQNIESLQYSVNNSGGVNLIKNSVGYFNWDNWLHSGAQIEQGAFYNSTISKSGFKLTGAEAYITSDNIEVVPNKPYTLSFILNQSITSTLYLKIFEGEEAEETTLTYSNQAYSYETITYTFIPNNNIVYFKFITDEDNVAAEEVLLSDIILNIGNIPIVWCGASSEICDTNFTFNNQGLTIKQTEYDGYMNIRANEIANYYQGIKAFSLDKEKTKIKKLISEEQIDMEPIKIIPINSGDKKGWAFVKLD